MSPKGKITVLGDNWFYTGQQFFLLYFIMLPKCLIRNELKDGMTIFKIDFFSFVPNYFQIFLFSGCFHAILDILSCLFICLLMVSTFVLGETAGCPEKFICCLWSATGKHKKVEMFILSFGYIFPTILHSQYKIFSILFKNWNCCKKPTFIVKIGQPRSETFFNWLLLQNILFFDFKC